MITWIVTVEAIEYSPNKNIAQVRFRPDSEMHFAAWQFVFLERLWFTYPDWKVMKNAYSIGSSYREYEQTWLFSTIVKKTSDTGMSGYLTQDIAIWDQMKYTWPLGHFIDEQNKSKYLFVSIGSGVTPIVSLYKQISAEDPNAQIVNLYGERYADDILPSLQKTFSNTKTINNILYLSKEENVLPQRKKWHIQDGLMEASTILQDNEYIAFLCGKPAMVDEVRELLMAQWLPKEQIIFEKY